MENSSLPLSFPGNYENDIKMLFSKKIHLPNCKRHFLCKGDTITRMLKCNTLATGSGVKRVRFCPEVTSGPGDLDTS